MIRPIGEDIVFFFKFTASKDGKTGLTPTVQVYQNRVSLALSGAVATELAGGVYYYFNSTHPELVKSIITFVMGAFATSQAFWMVINPFLPKPTV